MRANHQLRDNNGYHGIPKTELYDPFYDNLVLGLPMGGPGLVNGSTSFIDCSKTAKTPTVMGGAVLSNARSKYYGLSGYFPNASAYLQYTTTTGSELDIQGDDVTVQGYVNWAALVALDEVIKWGGSLLGIALVSGGGWALLVNGSLVTNYEPPTVNTWYHFCIERNISTFTLYLNGLPYLTKTSSAVLATAGAGMTVGSGSHYLQDITVHRGVALYKGSIFTPPQRGYLNRARRYAPGFIGA